MIRFDVFNGEFQMNHVLNAIGDCEIYRAFKEEDAFVSKKTCHTIQEAFVEYETCKEGHFTCLSGDIYNMEIPDMEAIMAAYVALPDKVDLNRQIVWIHDENRIIVLTYVYGGWAVFDVHLMETIWFHYMECEVGDFRREHGNPNGVHQALAEKIGELGLEDQVGRQLLKFLNKHIQEHPHN